MKKVLIISEVFYPEIGSGSTRMTNMMLKIKQIGYKVDVLTSVPKYPNKDMYNDEKFWDKDKENKINDGSNIYRINPSKMKITSNFFTRLYIYLFFMIKCFFKIIFIREKYDVVIATEPSIFIGLLGVVAKMKFRCKFILDIRDLWPECLKNISIFKKNKMILNIGYWIESVILKRTDSLIINSDGFREYLINKGYKNNIIFAPNGFTKEELIKNQQIINNEDKNEIFTVIYTGMLGLAQNVKCIVKAANCLRKNKNIHFKIIGTGVQKQKVLEAIEHYKLTNIQVIDPMPKEETLREVAKSHVALTHLRGDSAFDLVIPGKVIDYMGMGIPIVAGVEGYTSTIIKESDAGIVTEPDNYKQMAKAIETIYLNKKLQEKYSTNGVSFCRYKFNWNHNIYNITELINELLGGQEDEQKESSNVRMESLY